MNQSDVFLQDMSDSLHSLISNGIVCLYIYNSSIFNPNFQFRFDFELE